MSILQVMGHRVTVACSVTEAFAYLPGHTHLILDLMLPDRSGMELLSWVRQRDWPVRVAVITGASRDIAEQAREMGADLVIRKPVKVEQLIAWLERSVGLKN